MGKLGFFDSGIGGLTVMSEFRKLYPELDMEYFWDSKNCPYGEKSHKEIVTLVERGVEYLVQSGCVIIILACNTAVAQAVKYLQNTKYPAGCGIKILGVTLPGAEKVVTSKYQKVGVLATQSTVNNRAYGDRVRMLDPSVFVTEIAVPGLVNLLEMDNRDMNAINNLLKQAIVCFEPDTQALVLGCTHYPLVTKEILENWKTIHGTTIEIVDPGLEAAKKFKDYLERHPEFQLSVGGKTNLKFNKKSISPVASSQNIIPN